MENHSEFEWEQKVIISHVEASRRDFGVKCVHTGNVTNEITRQRCRIDPHSKVYTNNMRDDT